MAAIFGGRTITGVGTVTNNPIAGTVLADSGQIDDTGFYEVKVIASADAACRVRLEYRNAANSSTTSAFPIFIGASAPVEMIFRLPVAAVNERFRVAMDANLTGNACAHVNVNRVG